MKKKIKYVRLFSLLGLAYRFDFVHLILIYYREEGKKSYEKNEKIYAGNKIHNSNGTKNGA